MAENSKNDIWLTSSSVLLFCLTVTGMILRGAPVPGGDDLFWLGPAIGLLRTGQLTNPFTGTWLASFGTTYFFVQGPVYFYTLAGWFDFFGVSTAAIITFHWVGCIAACVGLVRFLKRVAVPVYIGFIAGTLFVLEFGRDLRPEPLASVFAFGALLLWEAHTVGWKT